MGVKTHYHHITMGKIIQKHPFTNARISDDLGTPCTWPGRQPFAWSKANCRSKASWTLRRIAKYLGGIHPLRTRLITSCKLLTKWDEPPSMYIWYMIVYDYIYIYTYIYSDLQLWIYTWYNSWSLRNWYRSHFVNQKTNQQKYQSTGDQLTSWRILKVCFFSPKQRGFRLEISWVVQVTHSHSGGKKSVSGSRPVNLRCGWMTHCAFRIG